MSFYAVLGVEPSASLEEIKRSYRALSLQYHPDKLTTKDDESFTKIQQAWETLRDAPSRQLYDQALQVQAMKGEAKISEEIDLDDMNQEAEDTFTHPCRCGDKYILTTTDMDNDINVIQCNGCSLFIKVSYEVI
uniref:Diphthamide biosynthesis protein 4 n=1 Tax=Arcella intermedia TaxID=1963864 RepID=A0A6B2LQ26_9EUKA